MPTKRGQLTEKLTKDLKRELYEQDLSKREKQQPDQGGETSHICDKRGIQYMG